MMTVLTTLGVYKSSCGCSRHVTERARRVLKESFAVLHVAEETSGFPPSRVCLTG
jgi:hypothetical protein